MKLPNKLFFKEQKKSQLKFYQMVLYNYFKIQQRQCSRKTAVKEVDQMEQDKIVLKTAPPVLYLQNPVFGIKVFTDNKKLCIKTNVKTNLNKN